MVHQITEYRHPGSSPTINCYETLLVNCYKSVASREFSTHLAMDRVFAHHCSNGHVCVFGGFRHLQEEGQMHCRLTLL